MCCLTLMCTVYKVKVNNVKWFFCSGISCAVEKE